MSFLTEIYSEIESEFEGTQKRNHLSSFYTLINYLELIDNGTGLSEQDLKEKFFQKKEYSNIVQKLINHSVLERTQEGKYRLNDEAKKIISPIFEDLMSLAYKSDKNITSNDPSLKLLYSDNSQMYSS